MARRTVLAGVVAVALAASSWVVVSPPLAAAEPDPTLSNPNRFMSNDGAYLYRAICQGCHMADAKGASGAGTYPALASNPKLVSPLYPAVVVMNGMKAMPAFGDQLSDEQIAAVVNYVRSSFGNRYSDALSASEVKAVRP